MPIFGQPRRLRQFYTQLSLRAQHLSIIKQRQEQLRKIDPNGHFQNERGQGVLAGAAPNE
jgi:hypothetical protein